MARKIAKITKAKTTPATTKAGSNPKFPYANTPNALRKFLEMVPTKPRPEKINANLLKAWGLRNTNDATIIRVLKALKLVSNNNEPTERYTQFMTVGSGPSVLANAIREVWVPLYQNSHRPDREGDETLRNYFNVHSGGSQRTMELQIQTYKAVCGHADFSKENGGIELQAASTNLNKTSGGSVSGVQGTAGFIPAIHIDLHIHLPENKTRRDYECMFEDISRYIYGRDIEGGKDGGE